MPKRMCKMMFGFKNKAMCKGCIRECTRLCLDIKSKLCLRDVQGMHKMMRKMKPRFGVHAQQQQQKI